ncbi:ninein-like protein isoform X3 [Motacilla alba alba]|uniref:ninein-like protein isoform X3 n=1 Tax=Motacilla alba alba TaxID=1094192 RepID=UPI0018D4FF15|nr:ninein-like protein isoform X3 [Motacilla alba alba]
MLLEIIRGERSGKQPVLLAKLPGPTSLLQPQLWICQASTCHCHLSPGRARRRSSGSLALPGSLVVAERQSSSTEQQVSLAGLPAAWDNTLMVPRSGLQPAADTSYRYKLQCLWTQVRQIARERDRARLSLEKAERHCLQLGRELDEQYIALEHTQSKLRNFQAEIEAKELLLQQAVSHQAKLEAAAQLLQGKEANLQGRLNHVMNENTQLQNKVTEMAEKLSASEEMVLDLQKELNHIVKDKLEQGEPHSPEFLKQSERFAEIVLEYERQCQRVKVLYEQNGALRRELQRLRLQLQDSGAERELPAAEMSLPVEHLQEQLQDLKVQLETKCDKGKEELSHPDVTRPQLGSEPPEHKAGHSDGSGTAQLQSQSLLEAECLRGAEIAARLEHHQRHAACWMEMELLQQQLQASQEKLLEAKASLSLAQAQHALQLQQARAQINNMVPKKQFEQLQNTLREEQCKTQQLQESLQLQAEQTCRQLVRTQEEHERLLQAAVEQAEGLEQSLRNAEAVLAERAAQLRDAQAQLSRNKLLIEELRGENRRFAMALQAAELKQKSMEEKNQLLEEQASALKQLIGKITPASLSG